MCINVNNLFLPLLYVLLFLLSLVLLIWLWFQVLNWMIADIIETLVFLPSQEKMLFFFLIQYKVDCSFLSVNLCPETFYVLYLKKFLEDLFVLAYMYKCFACTYVHHMHTCWVDSMYMGLQVAVRHCICFGDQTWVFWSNGCSPAPVCYIFTC